MTPTENRRSTLRKSALKWPDVQAILLADLCDSTAIKATAKGEYAKHQAARVTHLHNEIVLKQLLKEHPKSDPKNGHVLKEWGDEVIAIFKDPLECLRAAVRIQAAFNYALKPGNFPESCKILDFLGEAMDRVARVLLQNLLFSSHRLYTKVAVVFPNEQVHELFRVDSALAKPNEILISEEVTRFLNRGYSEKSYELLEVVEPLRVQPLRGIGKLPLGRLKWRQFPRGEKSPLDLTFASEAIAAFPFSQIAEALGDKSWMLKTCVPTALRQAEIEGFSFQKGLMDVLLVGQSLAGWAELLAQDPICCILRKRQVKVGVIKMRPKAIDQLRKTTYDSKRVVEQIKSSEAWFRLALKQGGDVLSRKYAHGLVEDTWGFFTHKAEDLFMSENDDLVGCETPILPYRAIAETYLERKDQDRWKRQVDEIQTKFGGNLPVEWCVHEIMFGPSPTQSVSMIFTMDWLNALRPIRANIDDLQYLLARRRCQYIYAHGAD